jgi:hypothetical protein
MQGTHKTKAATEHHVRRTKGTEMHNPFTRHETSGRNQPRRTEAEVEKCLQVNRQKNVKTMLAPKCFTRKHGKIPAGNLGSAAGTHGKITRKSGKRETKDRPAPNETGHLESKDRGQSTESEQEKNQIEHFRSAERPGGAENENRRLV